MKEIIIDWIKSLYGISANEPVEALLNNPSYQSHSLMWTIGLLIATIVIFVIFAYLLTKLLVNVARTIGGKGENGFQEILIRHHFYHTIAFILPISFFNFFTSVIFFPYPKFAAFSVRMQQAFFAIIILMAIQRFLSSQRDFLEDKPQFKHKPIQAYTQTTKLIIGIIFGIIILSILTNKSPSFFLTSLGAMTAILMLVFKDTIMGLVGSIQISVNDMVRIGDWIETTKYNADGMVQEINLTSVKIQNWDKSITMVPTYALITEGFKNWRGMEEAGGRRIKRGFSIKISSIKFADEVLIDRLSKLNLLKDFIKKQQKEIQQYNEDHGLTDEFQINARRPTNVGLYRRYIEYYLKTNPDIHKNFTILVRQLAPTNTGLPLEIYTFSNKVSIADYSVVIADIFDHLFAIIGYFDLDVHQELTGSDLVKSPK